MSFQEKALTCQDCNKPFTYSAREQESHSQKGYTNTPKRCPQCRRTRRDVQEQSVARPQSSRPQIGRPNSYTSNALSTTCARCGAPTRSPVQPAAGRHVYCSACYTKQPAYSRTY